MYSITKGEILRVVLFLWKGVKIYKHFTFVSDDLGGVIHHFRCGEKKFVTFKYVDLIGVFFWCELKCDRGGILVVFEHYLYSMFYLSHGRTFMLHCIRVMKFDNIFLTFSFIFVSFSYCWFRFFRSFRVGCENGLYIFFEQRGVDGVAVCAFGGKNNVTYLLILW